MSDRKAGHSDPAQLRSSAEDKLRTEAPDNQATTRDSDYVRLAHELQVHQVELELQNEELLRTAVELEQSLSKYADLYDFAPIAYFVLDAAGVIREVNLTGAGLLNTERSQVIGRRFDSFVAKHTLPHFVAFIRDTLSQDTRQVCELSLAVTEHPIRTMRVDGIRIDSPEQPLCRMALIDITDRIQKEQEVIQLNSTLEQRVLERTAALASSNDALERALLAKADFLATVSHELRTPLNGILAMTEALQESVYGNLTEKQLRCAASIETSGQHLLALINDLLDMSVTDAGQLTLHLSRFGVEEVCTVSTQMVAEIAKRKGQRLWTSVEPPGLEQVNDRRRVQQILINLLNNAVKFTPEGGEIELKAWIDRGSQMVVYSIQDTGIGIAADDIPRIFQPFVQLDTGLTRNFGGTGLGLVLARRMAELCGGQIGVDSTIGQGSRFYVTIPQLMLSSS